MPGHKEERTIKKMIAANKRMIKSLNNKFKSLKGRVPSKTSKPKLKKTSGCGCGS